MTAGTPEWLVRSLSDWAFTVRQGVALVTYNSSDAREVVLEDLKEIFHRQNLTTDIFQCAVGPPALFVQAIVKNNADVLFVLDPDALLFADNEEQSASLVNFNREAIVERPGVQIWWMPPTGALRLSQLLPDLNRFFLFREELTTELTVDSRKSDVNLPPIQRESGDGKLFFERALQAIASGADHHRVWLELGISALDGFLRAGKFTEAMNAFDILTKLAGPAEQAIESAVGQRSPRQLAIAFAAIASVISKLALRSPGSPGWLREGLGVEQEHNLKQAIAYYEQALSLISEHDYPQDWANTQYNLGTALSDLPMGDQRENWLRAIACYELALRIYTEQNFPREWAMTQHNLGTVLGRLPFGDRSSNLLRAIASYESVLQFFTEQKSPQQWAAVQNNLGNAWSALPTGDKSANLIRANDHYQAALRVYSKDSFPQVNELLIKNLNKLG